MKAIRDAFLAMALVIAAIAAWLLAGIIGGIAMTGIGIYVVYQVIRENHKIKDQSQE